MKTLFKKTIRETVLTIKHLENEKDMEKYNTTYPYILLADGEIEWEADNKYEISTFVEFIYM